MAKERWHLRMVLSLSVLGMMMGGCYDINDFVNFIPEEPPKPDTPYVPEDPGTIPDQDTGQTKPPGSGGITPGTDESNPNGTEPDQGDSSGGELIIPDALELEFITPASGNVRGGYEVRVRGKALEPGGRVQFGALASPQQIYVNKNVVRAVVPEGRPGCVDVTWTQNGESIQAEKAFCYTEEISVTAVEPNVLVAGNPTPVTLHGAGFDTDSTVYFGEQMTSPVDVQITSSETMTGILALENPGKPDLYIANGSSHGVFKGLLEVLPALQVNAVSPLYVLVGETPQLTLDGTGFHTNVKVRVGNTMAAVSQVTENRMEFTAPSLMAGQYDVLVYDDYRQIRLNGAIHYIDKDAAPAIVAVSPQYGSHAGGDTVTVVGNGLPETGNLTFGGTAAEVITRSSHAWTVKTPPGDGRVDVALENDTLPNAFEYVVTPQALNISPQHAVVADETVTAVLTGQGFTQDLRVKFGAFEASSVTVKNSSEAEVIIPQGSGTVGIELIQNKASVKTGLTFTYDEMANITGMSPNQSVILGGTTIEVFGQGFKEGITLWLDGQKIEDLTVHAANQMTFTAPAHEAGEAVIILKDKAGNEIDREILTYFNPSGINTSASGGAINGQLHVTVLTVDTAVPIPNATVYIGSDLATAYKRVTDANGRTSFFHDEIVGAQTVIACAPEHSCNTLQPINASNVTLFLEDWHANDSNAEIVVPPPPPPMDGEMINPIDVTVPYTPKPAYFTGTVGGFGKVDLVSDPNLVRAAVVAQSMLSPYAPSYYQDDVYLLFNEGDTYRIRARSGDVALALICGLYNKTTTEFTAKYIGVKRHQMVTDGAEIVNHLECPLPLNQTQGVKLLDAPLKSGPNVVVANAYLFMGNEGYIGGFMNGKSDTDLVVMTKLPPLRNELAEATYAIAAGAYTNMGYPASVFYAYDVLPQETPIEVGPAAPIPVFLTPTTEDILSTGKIAWKVEHPENVDFYEMTIRMYSSEPSKLLWQFYMPGTATTAEFPLIHQWPADMSGQVYIQLTAYKSIREGFDFNLFSTGDLRHNYIHSSAYATLFIRDPAKQ